MEDKEDKNELMEALRRKALGFTLSERTTEYDAEGNEVKNKVCMKEVPPDLSAIKLLLERTDEVQPTERELEEERERLLKELDALHRKKDKKK